MSLDLYEHLKVVGKGSYGEVWLVRNKKDKKQFVIKKMELLRASKREKKAAEQEAKLLSKLRHPNIVSYKDSFESEEGFLYIVMGFCDGGDLYNRLKQQKNAALEERQVVEWFVQIAMALQYMHERNILHRDLKTQNIFLTKSKIIKVGDLGIARVLEGNNDMATTLIGTPYYMSPELFSNRPYNHKSDVWALGCCVYEMTTLKHAFNAKDMNSLVYKILRGKMPAMPQQYSIELVELIKATLNQSPEKRPSVSRVLRNPYIKKHIAIFLEGTRARRPSTSSESSRRGSKADLQEIEEQSTQDNESGGKDLPAISEVPSKKPVRDNQSKSSIPRPSSAGKERKSAQGVRKSVPSASKEGKSRSNVKTPSEPKLPLKKSRPLPVPPKGGTPETSKGAKRSTNSAGSSRTSSSSSVSSSRDDASTPRTDRGSSARTRRREKLRESQEQQSPLSHVRRSSDAVNRSHDEPDSNHPRRPVAHTKSDPGSKDSSSSSSSASASLSRDERSNRHARTESRDTDSTISDDEDEDTKRSGKKKGDDDEIEEFSNLLATTLRIEKNKNKKVGEEGGDFGRDSPDTPEEPSPPPSARPGSGTNLNGTLDIAIEAAAPRAPKGLGNATMTTSGRLMDRIAMLRKDIMQGIGIELLTKAYELLEKDDDEDTEAQLLQLLGREKFEIYGGKIWQLKFCEETVFG
ncbi:serine/threonine-protein kinase Nek4 isoform X2 [Strongylocentrotus purpuratus]|uniref:Serine/threonine-protein kinase Nek4 n=1 Tax=Strongylocentrotus purpuratus TaxID=7668 RepID=A0A7M7ST57_STRPU|nr:serine/threonine-protein kinase Nek4 isoform X2 [Strongylocentrotus purpuratus]